MDVSKAIRERRSNRRFDPEYVVSDESLVTILEAAHHSPSACNRQPWRFVVIRNKRMIRLLLEETLGQQECFFDVPCLIVCLADAKSELEVPDRLRELAKAGAFGQKEVDNWVNAMEGTLDPMTEIPCVIRDTAMAVYGMMLQAVEQGLGTCWLAVRHHDSVMRLLEIPEDIKQALSVVCLLAVGKPIESPKQRPRLEIGTFAWSEVWGRAL